MWHKKRLNYKKMDCRFKFLLLECTPPTGVKLKVPFSNGFLFDLKSECKNDALHLRFHDIIGIFSLLILQFDVVVLQQY